MPAADYEPLQFVGKVELSITGGSMPGYLTQAEIDTGAGIRPLVYFDRPTVISTPVRMLTGIPQFSGGRLFLSGIFANVNQVSNVWEAMTSLPINQIQLTYNDGSADHDQYFNHCIASGVRLYQQVWSEVVVIYGSITYSFLFTSNENNPNFSTSIYDLLYTY